ncbi:Type-1 angiotensin II receptor A [Fasciola gigantica]|uniref:Type-1 angiotensin II receptor A n=1 Tax=Fasciola gigantica TaxID=46835 RepID=A0A504YBU0_FASGI|nr:Type-1 angiotensin II receptor A [Fasciola gigantica]
MLHNNMSDLSDLVGAFRAYISPVVAIFGLLGSLFIVTVFSPERPRTRFSIYAICLAISNAITLTFNTVVDDFMGRGLFYATNHTWYYKLDATSQFGCKLVEYIANSMYFTTSYIIVVFTLDRLLTVRKPITFYSIHHRRWATGICVVIYLLALIVNTPLIYVQTLVVDRHSRTNFTCRMIEDHPVAKFTITFEVIFTFTVPFCIVLILNCLIGAALWKLKHERKRLVPADRVRNQLEMGRVTGHLALSTAFLLLYMPMVCLVLIRLHLTLTHVDRHSPYAVKIIDLSRFFSSMKDITYAINFPLYMVYLSNFRRRFLSIFCPCFLQVTTHRQATRAFSQVPMKSMRSVHTFKPT